MSLNFKQICRTYLIIFSFPILSTSTWMPHPTVNAMKSLKSFQISSYFISPSCFSLCVLLRAPKVNLTSKWKSFLGLKMSWAWFNGLKRCLLLSHTTWVWPQDPQGGEENWLQLVVPWSSSGSCGTCISAHMCMHDIQTHEQIKKQYIQKIPRGHQKNK